MKHSLSFAVATLAALLGAPHGASANPHGGTVVGGSATISQPSPSSMTVNQQSDKAIINWQSFSIGPSESVRFQQPSASSVVLNRVVGGDSSTIAGQLSANGMVFLVNPNGVVFTPTARVDVNGLVATTSNIANEDFMAGRFNFDIPGKASAGVVNEGKITAAEGGLVGLVAPWVRNDGTIAAHLGKVSIGSGSAFTLDLYGDQLIQFAVPTADVAQATPSGALVTNTGTIEADGGTVWIGADTAKEVVDQAINTSGMVEAQSAHEQNGEIVLDAGPGGGVNVAGILDASGSGAGQTGGTVKVLGVKVALNSGATVNISGAAGGGTALIGGNFHGAGPERNAGTTTIASGAHIAADAVTNGNGGHVAVWSDDRTDFQGSISARGGSQGGSGGSVEVSSHGQLAYQGATDLRALAGAPGSLLLDPENVTITADGSAPTLPASGDTTFNPTADDSTLAASTLESALALGNVTVQTGSTGTQAGDITVSAPVSWATGNGLTLSAYRNVNVDASIIGTAGGNVVLRADNTGTDTGTVAFNGGSVSTSGAVSVYYNPTFNPGNGTVNSSSYTTPTDFSANVRGGATLTSYMLVNNVEDLQNVQNNLSAGYALGKNIDASATASWNSGAGFVPLGTANAPFTGILNGVDSTIDGLTISTSFNYSDVGLFGAIGTNGVVENIGLTNVSIAGSSFNSSPLSVGGIAGELSSATISQAYVTGTVSAFGEIVQQIPMGMLVGSATSGAISNSYATGVTGCSVFPGCVGDLGGLVGTNGAGNTITDSYAAVSAGTLTTAGTTSGQLAGSNAGTISFSYALSGASPLVGAQNATLSNSSTLTAAQLQSGTLPIGFSSVVWNATSGQYPKLQWQTAGTAATNVNFSTASNAVGGSGTGDPTSSSRTQQILNQIQDQTAAVGETGLNFTAAFFTALGDLFSSAENGLINLASTFFSSPVVGGIKEGASQALPSAATTPIDIANTAVAITQFLQTVSQSNLHIMDDEIKGICGPGPSCSSPNITDAAGELSNFPFMGVDNIASGLSVARMSAAQYQLYLTQIVTQRAIELGYTVQ